MISADGNHLRISSAGTTCTDVSSFGVLLSADTRIEKTNTLTDRWLFQLLMAAVQIYFKAQKGLLGASCEALAIWLGERHMCRED